MDKSRCRLMKKMSKKNVIEQFVDYEIVQKHIIDIYNKDDHSVILKICLLEDKAKDVADDIYDDLNSNRFFLKLLNNLDNLLILVITNVNAKEEFVYEM